MCLAIKVVKKTVDSYKPGKRIPSCQLCAEFSGRKITSFNHHVNLLGAKQPHDSFLIKPPASIFTGATKGMQYMVICVCISLRLCVTSAGVAVKIKRPSDEISGEGIMVTRVSYCDYHHCCYQMLPDLLPRRFELSHSFILESKLKKVSSIFNMSMQMIYSLEHANNHYSCYHS